MLCVIRCCGTLGIPAAVAQPAARPDWVHRSAMLDTSPVPQLRCPPSVLSKGLVMPPSTDSIVSLADHLALLWSTYPAALVGDAARTEIAALSRALQAELIHNPLIFECPLGIPDAVADFSIAVRGNDERPPRLPLLSEHPESHALLTQPSWQRIVGFVQTWAQSWSAGHRGLRELWLEFDLPSPQRDIPVPNLFFGGPLGDAYARNESFANNAEHIVTDLTGQAPSGAFSMRFRDLLSKLPERGFVYQIGILGARGSAALRLCLHLPQPELIIQYLRTIGCDPVLTERVEAQIEHVRSYFDLYLLHLDVGEDLGATIGVECFQRYHKQPTADARWEQAMEQLVQRQLCTRSKAVGLLAYPSSSTYWSPLLGAESAAYTSQRCIDHLKFIVEDKQPTRLKAYLSHQLIAAP